VWLVLAAGVAGLGLLGLLEARRGGRRNGTRTEPAPLLKVTPLKATLLRTGLFRVPTFAAGLGVQMAFSAGLQGFFLAFALWLQAGEHFSPLKAGLTAVAFSVGSFIGAPAAVPLAQKYGRSVLAIGGLLMAAGIAGEALAASHVGANGSPWPVVPGLVVAGAGLALLIIPLVNVVLAAVPVEAAGGASGLFGTAQQLGGALGVAVFGTVFFGYLNGHSFEAALVHTTPYAIGAFALCAILSMLLPRTAVSEEALIES
jgi:MFS family permease